MNFTGLEYLCIDIANNFGSQPSTGFKGDKALFQERIDWVKANFHQLEELTDQVTEDKYLYIKSVHALRDVVAGKATGHLISLDSTCSGLQLLAALTGCMDAARITNLTGENNRYDAYTEITDEMNSILQNNKVQVSRKDAKQAVMTGLYGSKATPREIFKEDLLIDAFYEACHNRAPGPFMLLDNMLEAWQPYALKHSWKMPDMFDVQVKVMQQKETKIEVDELKHHKFTTYYKENIGSRTGVSLCANLTHSVDAYVLRSLIRRCSYKTGKVTKVLKLLQAAKPNRNQKDDTIGYLYQAFQRTNLLDPLWFDYITAENVSSIPDDAKQRLIQLAQTMLLNKPFHVLTVHDAFRCSPVNGDAVRYWYKEILAELAESTLLEDIFHQITGVRKPFIKATPDLAKHIRESIYSVC